MKAWLRAHSTIYAHFDPAPLAPPAPRCHCGSEVDAAHEALSRCVTGFVVYSDGRRGNTYCDGRDDAPPAPELLEVTTA